MGQVLAAVMPKPYAAVEVRKLPEPQLQPDSALLEVKLSEICGTDVYLHEGRLAGVAAGKVVKALIDPLYS